MAKILYDTVNGKLRTYPRADDKAVIGLDPRYTVLTLINNPQPTFDAAKETLQFVETIDLAAGTVTHGFTLTPIPLPDAKADKIAKINSDCRARITASWPIEKQVSATIGIYGAAELAAMTEWIDAHIDASNVACDAVDAATTLEAVEAVTVAWPV
jgi:hypothetical protein